jgi:hypothetical protein
MAIALTATADTNWPPRVIVTATGLTVTGIHTVYRQAGGVRTVMRGWDQVEATDTSRVLTDGEAPFGVPVTYVLAEDDGTEHTATPLTVTLPTTSGAVALSDAITGSAAEVRITSWTGKQRARQAAVFNVGDRTTVVVSGGLRGATSTLQVATFTAASADNLLALINSATSAIVLLRVADSATYARYDAYLGVLGATENLYSQDGTDERRLFDLDVVEVGRWADVFEAQGSTYQQVTDAYAGQTYADLAGDFATYLDTARYDWAGA